MNRLIGVILIGFTLVATVGCGERKASQYTSLDGFALGTTYHIILNTEDTTGFNRAIDSLFEVANSSMSLYRANSLLSRLNRNETDSLDIHITRCIEIASTVSELSEGAYDITIKSLSEAWGFKGDVPTTPPNVDSLMQYVGYKKIRIADGKLIKWHPSIQIDLNSIAKGYTVDLMAEMIASRGIEHFLVEIGGEVVCRGRNSKGKEWTVGIDRPEDGNHIPGAQFQATLSFTDGGLATSGNYRQFYIDEQGRKVVHIIDARTGYSYPSNLLSVTIIAENAATADAMCTMMMAVGLDRSIEILEQESHLMGYFVFTDDDGNYRTYASKNLSERLDSR